MPVTVSPSRVDKQKVVPPTEVYYFELDGATTTDTFNGLELVGNGDRSIQLVGASGAGGFNSCTVTIEGSNDGGTTYATLTDPLGNSLAFTAAGIKQISEVTRHLRAKVTTGTAGTDLRAYLFTRV